MKNTETKARHGGDLPHVQSPVAEVKTALEGFMSDINSKLQQQEDKLTMFERKSVITGRPALSAAA